MTSYNVSPTKTHHPKLTGILNTQKSCYNENPKDVLRRFLVLSRVGKGVTVPAIPMAKILCMGTLKCFMPIYTYIEKQQKNILTLKYHYKSVVLLILLRSFNFSHPFCFAILAKLSMTGQKFAS